VKITRLRLSGFKSFVEPTELMIEPGRNGVVGPNGCGKSNLVEALRWVMGENSPKSMRGQGMDDVIFAGSGNRPSRNMAEVSLVIDNRERKAPAAFNGEDTLEVTRRIEREAGSIYRVNGREVRARDVQTLFADASTGAHSPALVRQGQIGELIAAKPRNRRMLLEEAAGISGLHSRRHEAELRLNAAETNLTRVQDLAQQLEGQLAGLRRQARQASRYRNLSGEIRSIEARLLASRWHAAEQAILKAGTALAEAEARVTEETARAARSATAEAEASEALPPLRDAEAKAAAALHRLTVERDMLEAEAARAAADLERLTRLLAQTESDLARETERRADAEGAALRLAAEKAELESATGAEAETVQAAEAELAGARTVLAQKEQALHAATSAEADAKARQNALSAALADAKRSAARLADDRTALTAQREHLEAEVARSGESEPLRAALAEAEAAVKRAGEALGAAELARGTAERAEQSAREPLQEADRAVAGLSAEAGAIAKLLGSAGTDLWPPVIDAITVEPGYEAALAAALGDDLNIPADRAAPAHWDDLGALSGEFPALPMGAEPLSRFVKAPHALARRLSFIGLVSAEAGKALQAGLAPGQRLVSRLGHLWRWDGYTVAAEAQTAEAARLAQRNRLEELKGLIASAEAKARESRAHYHELRLAAESAGEAERAERLSLRQAEAAANDARRRLTDAEKAEAGSRARLSGLAENEARLARDAEAMAAKIAESEAGLSRLPPAEQLRIALDEAREEAMSARHALAQAQSAVEILRAEERRRTETLANLTRELLGWQARASEAAKQIENLEARAAEARGEQEALAQTPQAIEEKRLKLMTLIADAGELRAAAGDALARAEGELKAQASEARAAEQSLGEAREARARLEATRAAAEERAEELRAHIHEALELTPEELLAKAEADGAPLTQPLEELEKKLERLKREREGLGGVNLRAEEEANEIETQLSTMLADKNDLEEAIAKLRQAIGKLNAEGRERLMGAFDIVNGHFKRLFTHLFGGGEAELRLVESDDPLEAGLEIFARPPGKRLQVMTLLSGGEQALTALSLIFAVFLSNPAPICVLDEVDAPLDDANVERFCNLVDEMTRATETRFLVITHHPLTMARMDRLYGVTMAERGVSQLVSVDLDRAVEVVRAAG
jgi:chromosome segregation protein